VPYFLAASTESNGGNDNCKNDSALHSILLGLFKKSRFLTRYLCYRQIGTSAELQRFTYLAAASAESNSGDYSRDYDHALYVHGLLSYHVFGNRRSWLPGCNAQIKNTATCPGVFHGD
jgi:hypothetical protein